MRWMSLLRLAPMLACLLCLFLQTQARAAAPTWAWTLERELPHDSGHFTQGLLFVGNRLYESSGGYSRSAVYELAPDSGAVLRGRTLPAQWFGEGLAALHGELLLLTWRNGLAQRFNFDLLPGKRQTLDSEGWGLTSDGQSWISSDGSARLSWRDADSLAVVRERVVRDGENAIDQLNELEWVNGRLLANRWHEDLVAVIDTRDGKVEAWLDLAPLKARLQRPPGWNARENVLNGLAWHAGQQRLYVTGKCWPTLFVLRVPALEATAAVPPFAAAE